MYYFTSNESIVSNFFKNCGKNMSLLIKDSKVWEKYEHMWNVNKTKLSIKFFSKPIYEQKYLKPKVREFDGVIKTNDTMM